MSEVSAEEPFINRILGADDAILERHRIEEDASNGSLGTIKEVCCENG